MWIRFADIYVFQYILVNVHETYNTIFVTWFTNWFPSTSKCMAENAHTHKMYAQFVFVCVCVCARSINTLCVCACAVEFVKRVCDSYPHDTSWLSFGYWRNMSASSIKTLSTSSRAVCVWYLTFNPFDKCYIFITVCVLRVCIHIYIYISGMLPDARWEWAALIPSTSYKLSLLDNTCNASDIVFFIFII